MNKPSFKFSFRYLQENWALVLAISVALFASYQAIFYAELPILEAHGFRQTQTAISAYWMIREGWSLVYQTPVAGYPWSIPFEFPIYQSLVALIAWLGNFPLNPVGRLVSFVFLLSCAWPALNLTNRLKLPSETAWVFCALLWSSPLYLFWGRAFMIETTAIFFTFAAIPYALDLFEPQPRWRSALLCGCFFLMGALQKATTAAPVVLVMGLIILIAHFKTAGLKLPTMHKLLCVCVALLAPILAALLWTRFTDSVKSLNPFGVYLTSSALKSWNFGTLAQRLNPAVLKTIFVDRVLINNIAGLHGITIILGALIFGYRQMLTLLIVCLILFTLPIAIFINLHYIHDYYQTSCTLFLIAALAIACCLWLPRLFKIHAVIPVITVLLVLGNFYHYSTTYAKNIEDLEHNHYPRVMVISDAIRRYTPEDSGIVVFGYDWSSEIAYYSERKSFTVPDSFKKGHQNVQMNPTTFLGGKKLGAMVFCSSRPNAIPTPPGFEKNPRLLRVESCLLWFPHILESALDKILPDAPRYLIQKTISCVHNQAIDRVNGLPVFLHQTEPTIGLLSVSGWQAVSAETGINVDTTYVTLTDANGNTRYLSTHSNSRNDVKTFFKQTASAPDIGFSTTVDVSGLHGNYTLGLARIHKGELVRCQDRPVPLKLP